MENIINVYVVWCVDGPTMVTLLQFEDSDTQKQAMQMFTLEDYVRMAWDAEGFEGNFDPSKDSYELVTIFKSQDLRFIY